MSLSPSSHFFFPRENFQWPSSEARSVFIFSEPPHPGNLWSPPAWLAWGDLAAAQPSWPVQEPLAPGWLPTRPTLPLPGLSGPGAVVTEEDPPPSPSGLSDSRSNKPLSAVARAPLPNPQSVPVYPMASGGGGRGGLMSQWAAAGLPGLG